MWSVGCIFAELLTHEAFFRGIHTSPPFSLLLYPYISPFPHSLVPLSPYNFSGDNPQSSTPSYPSLSFAPFSLSSLSLNFSGDNPQHQLEVIVNKMGIPSKDKLDFISSSVALNTITSCSGRKHHSPPKPFASYFPSSANPLAIDLLQRMLQFHPDDRITVEEALAHPYLKEFHGQMPEPTCSHLFDFQFEQANQLYLTLPYSISI